MVNEEILTKLKALISQSKYCEFKAFNERALFNGSDGTLTIKVKNPYETLGDDFDFQISIASNSIVQRTNDNMIGVFTGHFIFIDNEFHNEYTQLHDILKSEAPLGNNPRNAMLSRKPMDYYQESLVELIDRWGQLADAVYCKTHLRDIETITDDIPGIVFVNYSRKGELIGYNTKEVGDEYTILSYSDEGPAKDYELKPNYKYVGKRIGNVEISDQEISNHRAAELTANGVDYLKRLASLKVSIIGAGGSGSNVADILIRKGVKNLTLIDDDTIKHSNLQRMPLKAMSMIDQPKVNIFNGIKGVNFSGIIERINKDNLEILSGSDIVIMCSDNTEVRKLVGEYVTTQHVPYVDIGIGYREKSIISFVYYALPGILGNPTSGEENGEDDYNKSINLQLAESVMKAASVTGELFTAIAGLYDNPDIEHLIGYTYYRGGESICLD